MGEEAGNQVGFSLGGSSGHVGNLKAEAEGTVHIHSNILC